MEATMKDEKNEEIVYQVKKLIKTIVLKNLIPQLAFYVAVAICEAIIWPTIIVVGTVTQQLDLSIALIAGTLNLGAAAISICICKLCLTDAYNTCKRSFKNIERLDNFGLRKFLITMGKSSNISRRDRNSIKQILNTLSSFK